MGAAERLDAETRALRSRQTYARVQRRARAQTEGQRALCDIADGADGAGVVLVVTPTVARAREALRDVRPTRWRVVSDFETLRGRARGFPLLVLTGGEPLSLRSVEVMREAFDVHGAVEVTLLDVVEFLGGED